MLILDMNFEVLFKFLGTFESLRREGERVRLREGECYSLTFLFLKKKIFSGYVNQSSPTCAHRNKSLRNPSPRKFTKELGIPFCSLICC